MKGTEEIKGKTEMEVPAFELPEDAEHALMIGSDVRIHVNEEDKSKRSLCVPFTVHGGVSDGISFNQFYSLADKKFLKTQLVILMEVTGLLPEIENAFPPDVEPNDERVVNVLVARLSGKKLFGTTKRVKGDKYENVNITKYRKTTAVAQGVNVAAAPVVNATVAPAAPAAPGAPAPAAGW